MKIGVVSDLHLEFGAFDKTLGEGDVLLVPGDLFVAAYHAVKRPELEVVQGHLYHFMDQALDRYDRVLHVSGNHEHYNGYFDTTAALVRNTILAERFTHLDKDSVEINGVLFYGATFWTDFNRNDPQTMLRAQGYMNDYQRIYIDPQGADRNLHPHDVYCDHMQALIGLRSAQYRATQENKKLVVMSHHGPSKRSIHPRYARDYELNGAYSSDLEGMMSERTPLWVHGHTHDSYDYEVHGTRIICNPRGYVGHHLNPNFKPDLTVEI